MQRYRGGHRLRDVQLDRGAEAKAGNQAGVSQGAFLFRLHPFVGMPDGPMPPSSLGDRSMASSPLARSTIADVVATLRCQYCRQPPVKVTLVQDPAGEVPGWTGSPPGWRVVLIAPGVLPDEET